MNDRSSNDPNRGRTASSSFVTRCFKFLFGQIMAFGCLVGFPALVTAIAPVSWLKFERHDERVSFTGRTCLLFFVPYKTTTVASVVGVGDHVVAGTVSRRRGGKGESTRSEDQGYLEIKGAADSVEIPVTPVDLKSVEQHVETFLADPTTGELKMFVVANWKFSVFAGGAISMLTVLYVVIVTFSIALKAVHLVQKACGVPPQRWLWIKHMRP